MTHASFAATTAKPWREGSAQRCWLRALALLLVTTGCDKELCVFSTQSRCEGDVWVHCPGGWGNLNFTMARDDCRTKGERCVYESSGAHCMKVLATCDEKTFTAYCHPYGPNHPTGAMVECHNGEQLPIGDSCQMPKAGH